MAGHYEPLFGPAGAEREATLRDVAATLVDGRRIIAVSMAACLLLGLFWLLLATPQYTATIRVASAMPPNESEGLSTLAALLPGRRVEQSADPFSEYRVLLHSERLAHRLNAERRLGQRVFAYDETSGTFYEPGGPLTWIKAALRWIVGLPGWSPPEDAALAEYLRARIAITESADVPGIYAVAFIHPDRDFARDVLRWTHEGADTLIREAQRDRTERYIAFLTGGLQQEQNVETRAAMRALLLSQAQQRMLTNVDVGYAARIIDGPTVSPRPTSPSLGRTLLVALATGLGLGLVLVFARTAMR